MSRLMPEYGRNACPLKRFPYFPLSQFFDLQVCWHTLNSFSFYLKGTKALIHYCSST